MTGRGGWMKAMIRSELSIVGLAALNVEWLVGRLRGWLELARYLTVHQPDQQTPSLVNIHRRRDLYKVLQVYWTAPLIPLQQLWLKKALLKVFTMRSSLSQIEGLSNNVLRDWLWRCVHFISNRIYWGTSLRSNAWEGRENSGEEFSFYDVSLPTNFDKNGALHYVGWFIFVFW